MSARQKLNSAVTLGSLGVAALVGVVAESWTVFWLAAVVLIGMAVHAGDIRPTGRRS